MKLVIACIAAVATALPLAAQDRVPRIPTVQPPPPAAEIGQFCNDDSGCPLPGGIIPEHTNRAPEYPAVARSAGLVGSVELALLVRGDGSVDPAGTAVTTSAGSALDAAALAAVRTWRFTLLGEQRDGAGTSSSVTVSFVLAGDCDSTQVRTAWLPDRRSPHLVVMGCPDLR